MRRSIGLPRTTGSQFREGGDLTIKYVESKLPDRYVAVGEIDEGETVLIYGELHIRGRLHPLGTIVPCYPLSGGVSEVFCGTHCTPVELCDDQKIHYRRTDA